MKFAAVLLLLVGTFVLNCLAAQNLSLNISEKLRESVAELEQLPEVPEEGIDEIPNDVPYEVEEVPDLEKIIDRPDEIFEETEIQPRSGCSVSIKKLGSPQPLYLKPGTSTFWDFSATGQMTFPAGQNIELYCQSTYSNPSGKSGSQIATCVSGTTFKIGGVQLDLTKVLCSSWPQLSVRKTGARCNGGIMIESGFTVGSRFIKQMEMCFNEDLEVTRYVVHTLSPGSNYYQGGVNRPPFTTDGFFGGKDVDTLYTQASQTATIDTELGGVASKYINSRPNMFLSRGHMAAKADFMYGTEQRGTFLFLNAAPQWQSFNGGNWQAVEDSTRAWVSSKKKHVTCYTGVYGVTTLPNVDDVHTPLYMTYDLNHNGLIPVPKLFFRVVIEPLTKKGVVLIGVNNPHLTLAEIKKDYMICTDVGDRINWLTWKKTDITDGYSYACEVADFAKKNPNLPKFDVNGLLH